VINYRDIKDLHPKLQQLCHAFIAECEKVGIKVVITSTYRDFAAQNALYAQGRTTPGKMVTKAKAGE
jgi:peptidoglycan L-alanyl-D-glutamate endopeptidase CwlK